MLVTARIQDQEGPGGEIPPWEEMGGEILTVVQFYNCVFFLGTARIQLQEGPGFHIPIVEANCYLILYGQSCEVVWCGKKRYLKRCGAFFR